MIFTSSIHFLRGQKRLGLEWRHLEWRCLLMLACAVGMLGCIPRVHVIPHPTPLDPGIRYYRPKPYLLVTPAEPVASSARTASPAMASEGEQVSIELRYLPDFAEEYALDVRTGWGSADVSIELQDGWNLVSINQDLDSKVDRNLSAVGDLLKAVPSIASGTAEPLGEQRFVVDASNVPLGFYEAVIGPNRCGQKQLYGFRYVGFLPYATCPVCPTGSETGNCADGSLALYGLVFERGVMVFRSIGEIGTRSDPTTRVAVDVAGTASSRKRTTTTTEQNGEVVKKVEMVEIERLPSN